MSRFPQKAAVKGSQKWIQKIVNEKLELFDPEIKKQLALSDGESISWLSPRAEDNYAEYRDQAFLDLLGITLPKISLSDFWPSRGPVWDGVQRPKTGKVFFTDFSSRLLG